MVESVTAASIRNVTTTPCVIIHSGAGGQWSRARPPGHDWYYLAMDAGVYLHRMHVMGNTIAFYGR